MKPRIMAIDWGEKRLGIAVSDPLQLTAQPLAIVRNDKTTWENLRKLIREYSVKTIVVGIPFRTDGNAGEKAAIVRKWLGSAKENLEDVEFFELDERFTTAQAQRVLHEGGVDSRKQKKHLDKIAATLLLEQFMSLKKTDEKF